MLKIHQLQTQIYYQVDQSRYHGSAVAIKDQKAMVREKRAALVHGCASGQRATVESSSAELQRLRTTARESKHLEAIA